MPDRVFAATLSLDRGPFDDRPRELGDLLHVIDRLAGSTHTERFALYAPAPPYGKRRPHPANTASPGDEWTHRFDPRWPVSRFRYVGLYRLVRVDADGTWQLEAAAGSGGRA